MKTLITLAAAASALTLLSACGTTMSQRAATGAIGGAVVGQAVGHNTRSTVTGAAVGAAAGAVTTPRRH